jgi:hypothetical protein
MDEVDLKSEIRNEASNLRFWDFGFEIYFVHFQNSPPLSIDSPLAEVTT